MYILKRINFILCRFISLSHIFQVVKKLVLREDGLGVCLRGGRESFEAFSFLPYLHPCQLPTPTCERDSNKKLNAQWWKNKKNMHTPVKWGIMWRKLRLQWVFTSINFFSTAELEGSCIAARQIVFIISFEKCFLAFNWVIEPLTNSPIEAVRGWYSTVQDIQHTHTHRTASRKPNTQHIQHTAQSRI